MKNSTPKPKYRSSLRLTLGKKYFSFKRRLLWILGGINFAKLGNKKLDFEHHSHETPLLRQLQGLDMTLQHNKITNLKIAISKINNVTIYPDEVFSYWKLIGNPTKRKGYLDGLVLQSGTITTGVGGGLCQLSNLIYWITIHTPLTVIERHRHGYDVFPDADRTQPFGSGATCFYNYGDLMIKNNTNEVFQLSLEVTDTHLKGSWKSNTPASHKYEVYEKEHVIEHEIWGGYTRHNVISRRVLDFKGVIIDDEFVCENHAIMMYAPFISD